ncbi:MAG: flavodoxin family protein [Promethearchaeota archaeon]
MKIVGIMGSPRKNGASARMLDLFFSEIEKINPEAILEKIALVDYKILHCTGCDICLKASCPLDKEDDYPKIQEKLLEADAIVISTPNYFMNVPGLLKDFIDRSRRMKMNRAKLQDKIFCCMVASGLRNGGGETVVSLLNAWAMSHGMITIGGLGNPVIENPFVITTLQKDELKAFRKPSDPDEIAGKTIVRISKRLMNLLSNAK